MNFTNTTDQKIKQVTKEYIWQDTININPEHAKENPIWGNNAYVLKV